MRSITARASWTKSAALRSIALTVHPMPRPRRPSIVAIGAESARTSLMPRSARRWVEEIGEFAILDLLESLGASGLYLGFVRLEPLLLALKLLGELGQPIFPAGHPDIELAANAGLKLGLDLRSFGRTLGRSLVLFAQLADFDFDLQFFDDGGRQLRIAIAKNDVVAEGRIDPEHRLAESLRVLFPPFLEPFIHHRKLSPNDFLQLFDDLGRKVKFLGPPTVIIGTARAGKHATSPIAIVRPFAAAAPRALAEVASILPARPPSAIAIAIIAVVAVGIGIAAESVSRLGSAKSAFTPPGGFVVSVLVAGVLFVGRLGGRFTLRRLGLNEADESLADKQQCHRCDSHHRH